MSLSPIWKFHGGLIDPIAPGFLGFFTIESVKLQIFDVGHMVSVKKILSNDTVPLKIFHEYIYIYNIYTSFILVGGFNPFEKY